MSIDLYLVLVYLLSASLCPAFFYQIFLVIYTSQQNNRMPCVVTAMAQLENDPIQNAVHSAAAAKKRKRSRKVYTDKKFVCTHDSCGKSYSRAEHLYRHQLNRKS